jgi:hypothetical protein
MRNRVLSNSKGSASFWGLIPTVSCTFRLRSHNPDGCCRKRGIGSEISRSLPQLFQHGNVGRKCASHYRNDATESRQLIDAHLKFHAPALDSGLEVLCAGLAIPSLVADLQVVQQENYSSQQAEPRRSL